MTAAASKPPRPTADVLAITQHVTDRTRSLHFRTDQGPVVVRIPDADLMRTFADTIYEEAEEWEDES